MKRHIKRTLNAKRFFAVAIIVLIVSISVYLIFRPRVVKTVIIEAGSPMVGVEEFLRNKKAEGTFVTDVEEIDINQPGNYEMRIQVGKKVYISQLEITDSEPPTGTSVDVMVLKGDEVDAKAFVKDISDATEVTVSFARRPSTRRAGNYKVNIELVDGGNNKTTLEAQLTVLEVKESVQVEAGQPLNITTNDFVVHGHWPVSLITNLNNLDVSQPTEHKINLKINDKIVSSLLKVMDTTPPEAVVNDQEIYLDQTIEADAFVTDISDVSEVTCSFLRKPNFRRKGVFELTIVLEDSYRNKTQYPANLTIKDDDDPPVFIGLDDIIIYEGQAISYKKNVNVEDAKDGPIDFIVESSKVNVRKPGTYEIVYRAEDAAGNIAEETITVTVKKLEPTQDAVYSLADEILDKITKPEMTKQEVAYEIYKYVKANVAYTGDSDKTDVIKEAFRAIRYKAGDCFTYYALGEVLLTRAEIDNMMVTRVGGITQHFWSLINLGSGWYHFDASKHSEEMDTFMMTDADLKKYTKRWGRNYFVYDKSKFPKAETEPAEPME